MTEVETAGDLAAHVGQVLGVSDWLEVDQCMIDDFARTTKDHNWIHVDRERASRETPGGQTIAHGFLTLSLTTCLGWQTYRIRNYAREINYGLNKVRFISPVTSGARIRQRTTLERFERMESAVRLTCSCVIEIENQERPAMVAETISLFYDEDTNG